MAQAVPSALTLGPVTGEQLRAATLRRPESGPPPSSPTEAVLHDAMPSEHKAVPQDKRLLLLHEPLSEVGAATLPLSSFRPRVFRLTGVLPSVPVLPVTGLPAARLSLAALWKLARWARAAAAPSGGHAAVDVALREV